MHAGVLRPYRWMRMPEAIKLPSINGGVHCEAIRDEVFRNPIVSGRRISRTERRSKLEWIWGLMSLNDPREVNTTLF
ncbi:hypothetical protein AMD24_00102 [Candidatus Xiphinematobacter sp. Idaho Grape]|nr:hypothetical protein AMD24_00102 [Candidatus Xiphinematobacter sp. Idaho Grape]